MRKARLQRALGTKLTQKLNGLSFTHKKEFIVWYSDAKRDDTRARRVQKMKQMHSPMPRSTTNFDTVRKIGLALPGVEESTAYGSPALKVHGKLLACVPAHRSAEPGSLAVRVDFDDRAELLAADPDVYYVTDHYLNYTAVLVRLSRVTPDVLRDLLCMAHKFVTARRRR